MGHVTVNKVYETEGYWCILHWSVMHQLSSFLLTTANLHTQMAISNEGAISVHHHCDIAGAAWLLHALCDSYLISFQEPVTYQMAGSCHQSTFR